MAATVGTSAYPERLRVIPSPVTTIAAKHGKEVLSPTAYPMSALPGARDVSTPFGKMRVYEWGPEKGRKVVFVHGDATPSPLFSRIAHGLVEKGCRVMLLDLWGRGYSETPLDIPHDSRLFSMQILFAITSSSIPWTGPNKFSIVGFSLGAPISLEFITTFPWLVDGVVFLGPAGLIRKLPEEYEQIKEGPSLDRSDPRLRSSVEKALGVDASMPMRKTFSSELGSLNNDANLAQMTISDHSDLREFDMKALVQWQYEFNDGHVFSFYDTVRHGPAMHQEHLWMKFRDLITGDMQTEPPTGLSQTKVLIFFGAQDDVVIGSETAEDILKIVSSEKVEFKYVPGGHGFVYPNSETIVDAITSFWRLA